MEGRLFFPMGDGRERGEKMGRPKGSKNGHAARPAPTGGVSIRGSDEWLAWVDRIGVAIDTLHVGLERTQVIDYALRRLAEEVKVDGAPSRRSGETRP